ncbi:Hypothetical predicted protein [Paramuricea clavata]|uniref:Uncharacterized protein n=1 Tax=Paramuricea clavata TaxID=317549 RepID=A0A7D9ESD8_PARCT|nr:Hypothetical predicted protein [Paramuricea clavata]
MVLKKHLRVTKQTNGMVLPLSIEDESLTTGTASVLCEFAKDLNIIICKTDDHLTYNEHKKKFDINAACEHYKFYEEMDWHAKDMEKLRNQLEESEPDDFETMDNITVDPKPVDSCQGGSFKQRMKQASKNAKDVMKKLKNDILKFTKRKTECCIFSQTVDTGLILQMTMDKGCWITPVMIAVNNNQPDIVRILVKYGARTTRTFQGNIAMQIGNHEIIQILENQSLYETNARKTVREALGLSKELSSLVQSTDVKCSEENASLSSRSDVGSNFNLTVGDAKSASTLRGVRNRAPDEFGSFKEVPGDFHTQACVMECLSFISRPGGFFYTIRQVLKVTPKSFVGILRKETMKGTWMH